MSRRFAARRRSRGSGELSFRAASLYLRSSLPNVSLDFAPAAPRFAFYIFVIY
jgi:hypothetical protein